MSESEEVRETEGNEVGDRVEEVLGRIREVREPMIKRRRRAVDRLFDVLAGRRSGSRRATEFEEELQRENEELKARLRLEKEKEEEEERSSRISGIKTTKDGKSDIAVEL